MQASILLNISSSGTGMGYLVGFVIAIALAGYLIVTLVKPDKF